MAQTVQRAGQVLEQLLQPRLAALLQPPGKRTNLWQCGCAGLRKAGVVDGPSKYVEKFEVMLRQQAHIAAVQRHADGGQMPLNGQHD